MSDHPAPAGYLWRPSITRHVPWLSFLFILGFVACCVGLGVILYDSNDKVVGDWPTRRYSVSVSVLLSLLVGVANFCLTAALKKGYEVAWWNKAIKGAEVRRLQFDLGVQQSLGYMLSSGIIINQFSVAAIIAIVVSLIDGPIIQRASNVVIKTGAPSSSLVAATVLDGYLPADFSGYGLGPDLLTPMFSNVSLAYQNRDPIAVPVSACSGSNTTCSLDFPGLGFDVHCNRSTVPYDFGELGSASALNNITTFSAATLFGGDQNVDNYNAMHFTSVYKPDTACQGHLVKRSCYLRLSTVNYPLTVTNGTATIQSWDESRNDTIAWANITAQDAYGILYNGSFAAGGLWTMLGGVYGVLDHLYTASSVLVLKVTMVVPYDVQGTGASASNYITSGHSTYGNCTMTWSDPTVDYVNTARELMLRSVLAYASATPGNTSTKLLPASMTTVAATYTSEYRYLAATVACMAVFGLVIVVMLSGWRHLGRDVSLDAFELSRALGAPLLQGGSSNSDIATSLKPISGVKLRYGEVQADPKADAGQAVAAGYAAQQDTQYHGAKARNAYELVSPEEDRRISRLGLVEASRVSDIRQDVLY